MIRMMLAIATVLDCEFYMMDVQREFLNLDVEEETFVKMPPGYDRCNKAGVLLVMKLKKDIYRLCQSIKNWFGAMDQFFAEIGFSLFISNPCVYNDEDEVGFVVLTLYVDDLLLLDANEMLFSKLKKQLMDRSETMNMGDVSRDFGMMSPVIAKRGRSRLYQRG